MSNEVLKMYLVKLEDLWIFVKFRDDIVSVVEEIKEYFKLGFYNF